MKLTIAQIETLKEMRYHGFYKFRQATARKLEELGLCEVVRTTAKPLARPGRRITPAGLEALRAALDPKP